MTTHEPPLPRRAVLFDFFGTLVDFDPDLRRVGAPATHAAARSLGYVGGHDEFVEQLDTAWSQLADESLRTMREFDAATAFTSFANAHLPAATTRQIDTLAADFSAEWTAHIRPIAGVAEMLGRLGPSWSIAIVSNTHSTSIVPSVMRSMGIDDVVDVVVLSVDHGWIKPHRSIYDAALSRLGADPATSWFVGDSLEPDYLGPRAIGMQSLLIDPQRRHEIPVDHRLDTVLDVEATIDLNAG
ncbi:MAG: HAD family hydrolase [Actinomycetota bacterium]